MYHYRTHSENWSFDPAADLIHSINDTVWKFKLENEKVFSHYGVVLITQSPPIRFESIDHINEFILNSFSNLEKAITLCENIIPEISKAYNKSPYGYKPFDNEVIYEKLTSSLNTFKHKMFLLDQLNMKRSPIALMASQLTYNILKINEGWIIRREHQISDSDCQIIFDATLELHNSTEIEVIENFQEIAQLYFDFLKENPREELQEMLTQSESLLNDLAVELMLK